MQGSQNGSQAGEQAFRPSKPSLIDIPISNNGARCRFVIYKENLSGQVDIVSPGVLGGLKSEQALALNKQGKCPALILPGTSASDSATCIPESEVVVLYLLEKYAPDSSLLPKTPELKAKARVAARVMDVYITPIQACMYRPMEKKERAEKIQELARQLDILETCIEGPYVLGKDMSHADGALFPTLTWMNFIMPRHFGWKSVFTGRPKLQGLFEAMQADPHAKKVMTELEEGLQQWQDKGRWADTGIDEQVSDASFNWACA